MVAPKGRQQAADSKQYADESPRAVAAIIRLIHDLYAANGLCVERRDDRDDELINWCDVVAAVQGRHSGRILD
jgi:hypothetical protein